MSNLQSVAMDAVEIDEFLADRRTGVLSLARADDGYGIPVAFAYDPEDRAVYFRLGYWPESQKRAFVEASGDVSFVVYDHTEDGWKSVVARGPLEELSESSLGGAAVESVRELDIPFVTIFERDAEDIEFHVTRLAAHELTGRKEADGTP